MRGGIEMSISEIVKKGDEMKPYFSQGGGITVTGGEPLLQAEAVLELIKQAHKKKINVAVDTNGSVRSAPARRVYEEADLILLDVKHWDEEKHRQLTGQGNKAVKETLLNREATGKPMWVRHVLVPGYTDHEKDLEALGRGLANYKTMKRLEILPYHSLGAYKYEKLGLKYEFAHVASPTEKQIANAKKILEKYLKNVIIR